MKSTDVRAASVCHRLTLCMSQANGWRTNYKRSTQTTHVFFRFPNIKGFYTPIFAQCTIFGSLLSMKSYLFVSFLAVAVSTSQGFRSFQLQDPTEEPPSGLPDAPSVIAPTEIATPNPKPHDRNCDCNGVCNDLNEERLPPYLQVQES